MVATSPWAAPAATTAATATGRPHPTYTKMITQALAELGGTCGRAAIAGFIFGRFTGLPASHDALLSAHLRRLVAEGVVRSYGRCYVFPASNTRGRGRPRNDATPLPKNLSDLNLEDYSDDDATPLRNSECGYVLSDSQPQQNSDPNLDGFQSNSSGEDDVDEYTPRRVLGANSSRGRPRKRRCGRPRKVNLSANGDASSVTKRGRGRPRKLQKDGPSPSPGGDPSTGIKRGHGRPRKEEQQSEAKYPPTPTASTGGIKRGQQSEAAAEPPPTPSTGGIKRGRGRPTKDQQSEAAKSPPTPPASRGFKVGCGRPMLATSGDTGPPRSWRPIIIEKLPPARWSVDAAAGASPGVKRPRGRPRMYRPMPAETADETPAPETAIKRGRGRPRKKKPAAEQMSAETGDAAAASTGIKGALENPRSVDVALENPRMYRPSAADIVSMVMKRGCGRPRKEQPAFETEMPAAARSVEAGDATRAEAGDAMFVEAGDARSAETGDATPAEETGGAASTGIKRGRGQPEMEMPAATMSAEAGDARPAEEAGDATPAETGGAASAGIKRPRGRPRQEKPAAAMSAEASDAASAEIKRGRGRPRKERPDSASAGIKRGRESTRKYKPAVSAEAGDAVSTGMKGQLESPSPRVEKPSARDIVSMVMNRECGPAFETWFGDMAEASRRRQQEEGGEKTTSTRPRVEEEKAGDCVFGTGYGGIFGTSRRKQQSEEEGVIGSGDKKETRLEDAGCVPVSVENAAPVEAVVGVILV